MKKEVKMKHGKEGFLSEDEGNIMNKIYVDCCDALLKEFENNYEAMHSVGSQTSGDVFITTLCKVFVTLYMNQINEEIFLNNPQAIKECVLESVSLTLDKYMKRFEN